MAIIQEILKKIDIFGVGVNFKINGGSTRDTALGGFMSLVIAALSISGIIWYGEDIIAQQKPYSLFIEEVVKQPDFIDISSDKFSFALGIQSQYQEFIDPEIYRVECILTTKNKFFNQTSNQYEELWIDIPIQMEPCTPDHFQQSQSVQYFTQLAELNQKLCLNVNDLEKIGILGIQGDFVNEQFSMLRFRFFECQDDPERNFKCQNQTEIDQKLQNAVFTIYYTNNIIQRKTKNVILPQLTCFFYLKLVQNLERPFIPFARDYFSPTSNQMIKYSFMYFRTVYIETDVGWLMEDIQTMQGNIIAGEVTDSIAHRDVSDKNTFFQELQIRCEKSRQGRYRRTYKQVQNLIAELGGLLKVLVVVGAFICVPIADIHLKKNLINTLYTFDGPPRDLEIVKLPSERNKSFSDTQVDIDQDIDLSNFQPTQFTEGKAKYFLKDLLEKIFSTVKQVLLISGLESVLFYLFPFGYIGRQQQILNYSYDKFSRHLDTFYIVKKLLEIDKLKMVIFNEDQRQLFQYLPQPLISCQDYDLKIRRKEMKRRQTAKIKTQQECFNTMYFDTRSEINRMNDAVKSINQFMSNQIMTQFDKKIINLLDPEILQILEEEHKQKQLSVQMAIDK